MEKTTAAIVATAIVAESILPQHSVPPPHTEVNVNPPTPRRESAPLDGRRLAASATLGLIVAEDLVTLPHNGQHVSLKEIRAEANKET
jgi:hypothetical protein